MIKRRAGGREWETRSETTKFRKAEGGRKRIKGLSVGFDHSFDESLNLFDKQLKIYVVERNGRPCFYVFISVRCGATLKAHNRFIKNT